MLPSWGLGVAPTMAFRWPGVSVALEAQVLYGADPEAVSEGGRMTTSIVMAAPTLCGHRGAFFLCGLFGAGELRVNGQGSALVETEDPWLMAIGLRAGFDWFATPRLALRGHFTGVTALGRPALRVENAEAWRTSPFGAVLGLGIMIPLGVESPP